MLAIILLIFIGGIDSNEVTPDFRMILSHGLKTMPYLRIAFREGVKSDVENIYVNFLLKQTDCPVMVTTYSLHKASVRPAVHESFAIVVDMSNLNAAVKYFVQKAGSFYFIIPNAIDTVIVDTIFRALWKTRQIFKTFLLTPNGMYLYDPFAFDKKTQIYGNILALEIKNINRVINDLNKYPLRVQIFRSVYARPLYDSLSNDFVGVEGADAEVARTLQERMNFTMILQQPTKDYFGERSANGTYNGAIGMVIRGETDICLTGFFVKDYMVPNMEFSVAVYDDQLCCYVPKAPRIPQSILPIFAVRYDFWLGFIITAFVCGTVWACIRRINLWIVADDVSKLKLSKQLRYQLVRIYIDTWVVWVRVNIINYPPFASERIFILSLCLVSVIFGAIIESSLATVYIHPMYYNDINTLQDLDKSGLDIIYKYTSFKDDLFFSETSRLFAALNKKLKHLSDLHADLMRKIADTGGIASVTRYSSLMLESINYILAKKVHVVKECPKYYTIAYVMPKDSPFNERINSLLLRFLNAGLIEKWIKDMHFKANMIIIKSQEIEESSIFKILTMVDLQLAFYVVIVGSIVAFISLAAELYLKRERILSLLVKPKNK